MYIMYATASLLQNQQPDVAEEMADRRADYGAGPVAEEGEEQRGEEDRQAEGRGRQQVAEGEERGGEQRGRDRAHPLFEAQRHVPPVEELFRQRDRRVAGHLSGEVERQRHVESRRTSRVRREQRVEPLREP